MTLSKPRTQPRDFAVTLTTQETDEDGVPWERKIGVQIEAGITPQWDEWLTCFNQHESQTHFIQEIIEMTSLEDEF